MDRLRSFLKKVWRSYRALPGKWQAAIAGLVVVILVVASATSSSNKTSSPKTSAVASSKTTSAPEVTTSTAHRTTTSTARPTTTTTAPRAPTVYDGRGDKVLTIAKPTSGPVFLVLSHRGSANFIVDSLDSDLNESGSLVNEIGRYDGRRLLDIHDNDNTKALKIQADGAWHIEVHSLADLRRFSDAITGTGDDVVYFTGKSMVGHFTHNGDANFIVDDITENGSDNLINEIGHYDGSVPVHGPGIVAITANGAWTIAPG